MDAGVRSRAVGDWRAALVPVFDGFLASAVARIPAALPAVDHAATIAAFRERLGLRLVDLAARTLVGHMRAERRAGRLTGADPHARFACFAHRMRDPSALATLLARHPVLATMLTEAIGHAVAAHTETIARLHGDRAEIVATLLGGTDPGPAIAIEPGLGDRHGGGRSVTLIRFGSGATVVYKPRPIEVYAHFADLIRWSDRRLGGPPQRTPAVVVRPGYGWVEYAHRRPCRTPAEAQRFFRRLGRQMALLYAIDATDLHYENVVAAGDQPILIDLETLFHPELPLSSVVDDPAARRLAASVIRLLLLPQAIVGTQGASDVSGLGGDDPFHADSAVLWQEAGTDRMHLVRGPVPVSPAANRPSLRDGDVDVVDHEPALIAGFTEGYRAIADHRADFLALAGQFAADDVRVVARPTMAYAELMVASTDPELLHDPADRRHLFERLAEMSSDPVRSNVVTFEIADLTAGDIPLFVTQPGSCDIRTADGTRLRGLLAESGLDRVRAKAAAMGAEDLHRQLWIIEAAIAARRVRRRPAVMRPLPSTEQRYDPQHLLDAAESVGRRILGAGVRGPDMVNWIGLTRTEGGTWMLAPLGAGLLDGYSGVALFLAELFGRTGRPAYADAAAQAMTQLPRLLDMVCGRPLYVDAIGADGFAGLAYACRRIAAVLSDPSLKEAGELAGCLATASGPGPADPMPCDPTGLGLRHGRASAVADGGDPDAIRALIDRSPLRDLSFCHGELGMVEALMLAADRDRCAEEAWRPQAARAAAAVGAGQICGTPGGVPVMDLLHGLAGIGYQLLRLGLPADIPSILDADGHRKEV